MSADPVADAVECLVEDLVHGIDSRCAYCGSTWSGHRCHMEATP